MARRKSKGPKSHKFMNKLLLNQWLISLFGIDPLVEQKNNGKVGRLLCHGQEKMRHI